MYTVSHYQGYDMPTDTELLESYEGEAREIILQSFIDEGVLSYVVYTTDETTGEDIELEVMGFLTPDEVTTLKDIEQNNTESFWDGLTVQTLSEVLKADRNAKEAA